MWYIDNRKFYDQLFNEVFDIANANSTDMKDHGDHFAANLVVPGADKQDFKITSQDNRLHLSYNPEKGKNPYCGNFSRTWKFTGVDLESIKASYVNGILTISVPKSKKPEAAVRTINVN